MVDLNRAFECDNGVISDGVILPSSIFSKVRSSKPTYTNDEITSIEYYNSHTQVDANRIAKVDITYTNDSISGEIVTYYDPDGVSVFSTETYTYTYTSDNITNVEGS